MKKQEAIRKRKEAVKLAKRAFRLLHKNLKDSLIIVADLPRSEQKRYLDQVDKALEKQQDAVNDLSNFAQKLDGIQPPTGDINDDVPF